MDNRFGVKELVIATLLVILIAIVLLAMKQYDRQYQRILGISQQIDQQTAEQARLRRDLNAVQDLLEKGIVVSGTSGTSGTSGASGASGASGGGGAASQGGTAKPDFSDPFARMNNARKQPDFAEGDWLIDAFGATVAKITPLVTVDAYGSAIQGRVLETLAVRDPDTLKWLPLLAERWSISDDGLTIRFTLRRGLTFSDGHPLTSADVLFTWKLINDPKLDAPRVRLYYDKVREVTAEGEREVTFHFKEPYFESFGMAAGMEVLPEHFYKQFTAEELNKTPGLLLGSGPYRMPSPTDWVPGKLLELVRNERYWGAQPAFDRLVYREVNLEPARLIMYRNREIDVFHAQPEQYVEMLKDQDLLARSQRFEFERANGGYGFIAWNQRRAGKPTMFADARVRRAMTMMIDRQRLFDEILLGYGIPVTGPFNRLSPQTDPDIQPWPYDVNSAKALLKEMGYSDRDGDGVLDGPDGKPLRFAVTYPANTGIWDRILLMLRDSLARAGVVMDLEPLEWSVFDQRVKGRDFDALCMGWGASIETDIRQMFHSSQIAQGADNFVSYSNPTLDALIDQARGTVVAEKRYPLWQQCHRILHEDQPYTFLYSRKSLIFIDHRVRNIERTKLGLNDYNEWFVPEANQLRNTSAQPRPR